MEDQNSKNSFGVSKEANSECAAIYVRTAAVQEAGYQYGLAAQIEACQAYCNAHGYTVQHIYQDVGTSGISVDRPGLNALLTAGIDIIVIYDYNRISRDVGHVTTFLDKLETKHIRVETVAYGTDSDMARFALAVMGGMQQIERHMMVKRMQLGKAAKKAQREQQQQ
jgi:DNA invertase Pin-like site-specific DNA recombinase